MEVDLMNWLGIFLIAIGISYLIYSIMFRNKTTIYFRGPERLVGICIDKGYKFPLNQCFKAYLFFIFNSLKCFDE